MTAVGKTHQVNSSFSFLCAPGHQVHKVPGPRSLFFLSYIFIKRLMQSPGPSLNSSVFIKDLYGLEKHISSYPLSYILGTSFHPSLQLRFFRKTSPDVLWLLFPLLSSIVSLSCWLCSGCFPLLLSRFWIHFG